MTNIGGFTFEDEVVAAQAKKEEEGIRFIKEKSALNNPEVVLKLYKTVLQQKLFVTPVGFRFLMELQDFLMNSPSIDKEDIPSLDAADYMLAVVSPKPEDTAQEKKQQRSKGGLLTKLSDRHQRGQSERQMQYYKRAFHISLFFAIIFGISVLGMFAIAEVSSDNVNILNYREKIINQYEQWEQELESEQQRLEEWEEELSEKESALKETDSSEQ